MRVRTYALLSLGLLAFAGCTKAPSTDDLIGDLNSSNDGDRLKAVRWLQSHQGRAVDVVPALTSSLKDVQADVRLSAAVGLGYYGKEAESAIPELKAKAEKDTDARVRNAASAAISRIRE